MDSSNLNIFTELSSLGDVNILLSGTDDFKPRKFECEATEGFKQVYALAW